MPKPSSILALLLAAALVCLPAACRQAPSPQPSGGTAAARGDATRPAHAVLLLTAHLRANDLEAFARDAVPPDLHRRLEHAWRRGHSRWPLDELPFDERLPQLLGSLAEAGSEAKLQAVFDRQFANAHAEIEAAATTLGLFGVQYVRHEGDFSASEREHYSQFVAAIGRWGTRAPLGDPARARVAIPALAAAARATGLTDEQDFSAAGMAGSLRRLGGFLAVLKQVLARYGLLLDESLGGLEATLQAQTGDTATVRMRYTLAGEPVDAVVALERHDGRWYLSDYLRHAEASLEPRPSPVSTP